MSTTVTQIRPITPVFTVASPTSIDVLIPAEIMILGFRNRGALSPEAIAHVLNRAGMPTRRGKGAPWTRRLVTAAWLRFKGEHVVTLEYKVNPLYTPPEFHDDLGDVTTKVGARAAARADAQAARQAIRDAKAAARAAQDAKDAEAARMADEVQRLIRREVAR